MTQASYRSEVVVVGGGIAGVVAAIELLSMGKQVVLIDRDTYQNLGGLAKESFGGMFFVDSPLQRKRGIKDSVDLALRDWHSFADFTPEDYWPQKWAEQFIHLCTDQTYHWLHAQGIRFFPFIHWVERGLFKPGNSVPRFHMVWGTGWELAKVMVEHLLNHPHKDRLNLYCEHRVQEIITQDRQVVGVQGIREDTQEPFEAYGEHIVVATGGISGNLEKVRKHWYKAWGEAPSYMLNGAHYYAIGDLHDAAEKVSANVTHLDRMWNYAAGVHHPDPNKPLHGLSLVPPRSALWVDYQGKRFGPMPLMTSYDTRFLVEQISKQKEKYSWQILNYKIAKRELAVSGSQYNDAIRNKQFLGFVKGILMGNKAFVDEMIKTCNDFVTAYTLEELAEKMNRLTAQTHVKSEWLSDSVLSYDAAINRGKKYHNDEQLRRIAHLKQYLGDRLRLASYAPISDPRSGPFIAIREHLLSRKSLGGIQTDLQCRVISKEQPGPDAQTIPGLYAVGEAAGFGGGGIHGHRSLEGTFLASCVLTGRIVAHTIAEKTL